MSVANLREVDRHKVRKPLFCKTICPRAPLARMIGKRSRSGLSTDLFGQVLIPDEPSRRERPVQQAIVSRMESREDGVCTY